MKPHRRKKTGYKYCLVPMCRNTTFTAPNKLFFDVPRNSGIRRNWCKAMWRDERINRQLSAKTRKFCCEDHFDVEKDTENFTTYKLSGQKVNLRLKKDVLPHKFHCQKRIKKRKKWDSVTEAERYNTPEEGDPIIECRSCLQILNADSSFFNIFDGWMPPWDGMENTMAEDLAKLANIEISEDDEYSHMMCETCCQVLLTACNFAATVRRNDKTLRGRVGEESKYDPAERIWPKPIQVDKSLPFENAMDIEIKQEVLSDEEGATNGLYEQNLEDHIPNLDIVKVEPEEIQQKPIQTAIENGDLIHQHAHEANAEQAEEYQTLLANGNSNSGDDNAEPAVKEEPISDEEDIDPHITADLSLDCMLCTKTLNSVSGLKAHVIAHHSYKSVKRKNSTSISPEKKKRKYTCAICRRNFSTSTDLMVHETCHNKSVCYGCNEKFDTFVQLTTHRLTCKAIASKKVARPRTLDDVLRPTSKEPEAEFKCSICNECFTDEYYLSIHQEIHHNGDVIEHQNPYMMSLKVCRKNI